MKITMDMVKKLAPDAKSMTAAKSVAAPKCWGKLGEGTSGLWGECKGSSTYNVYVELPDMNCYCTCPSRKRPCKHALGLLSLAAGGHPVPQAEAPPGFVEAAMESRYDEIWE
jgi:hypothetical protein